MKKTYTNAASSHRHWKMRSSNATFLKGGQPRAAVGREKFAKAAVQSCRPNTKELNLNKDCNKANYSFGDQPIPETTWKHWLQQVGFNLLNQANPSWKTK